MDCKGHTGMMMSLGKGSHMSSSRGQKKNTGSSTETELVGVDDVLAKILWGKYFIENQGYTVEHNIMLQDNKSTILLAKNGTFSSGKKTKHIKHKFFLIKNKIEQGDIEVEYCPTDQMWSDIMTKAKQGKPFYVMRSHAMNVPVDYDDEIERRNTHPSLLPDPSVLSPTDSQILKTALRKNVSFSPDTDLVNKNTAMRRRIKKKGTKRSITILL